MIIQDGTVKTRTPGIVHLLMMCIFFLQIKKKNSFFICHLRREGVRCQNDFFKNLVLIQIENEIILTNLLIKLTQGGGSRWRGGWRGGAG